METLVRKDLDEMIKDISFVKIKTRYNERNVAIATLFNDERIEFKDRDGLYDLFMAYRKSGVTDFIKSKKLIEEPFGANVDISKDEVDESTGTYVCVLFELFDGKKYRLFPSRKYTDRKIIDVYYDLFKKNKTQLNKEKSPIK